MTMPFVVLDVPRFDKEGNPSGEDRRRLRFNMNALCLYEQIAGKPLTEVLPKVDESGAVLNEGHMGLNDIRMLLFVGLKWDDKSMTMEKAGEIMDVIPLDKLMPKVSEALQNAFPKKKTETEVDNKGEA